MFAAMMRRTRRRLALLLLQAAWTSEATGCQGDCQGCGQCCQHGVAMPTSQCFDDPTASFCCPEGCHTPTCGKGEGSASAQCDASTFSLDLGNTHCPRLWPQPHAATADACMKTCCAAGDACETWQWCESGRPCAQGFWPQPGSLSINHDLAGWPKNTTLAVAEAACQESPA